MTRKSKDLPKIKKIALRWPHLLKWEWDRPRRYLFLGLAESGKSNLNEHFAAHHPKILDLYGSKDNENLCWCRESSPVDDILLVHGDNTSVSASWDTKKVSDVKMRDIERHECTITTDAFYSTDPVKYSGIQTISDNLYNRKSWRKGDIIYLLLRETMNVIYSRLSQGKGEKEAKADLLYFIRELRHFGFSVGYDSLRWTGLEKEIRDLADFMVFKRVGEKGLPRDKRFLYGYVEPKAFAQMNHNEYVLLKSNGAIGYGQSPLLKWHKEEGIDLVKELGIEIDHGEEILETEQGRIGDREHERIIRTYLGNESMELTSKLCHRGLSTVSRHVAYHNDAIAQTGSCPRCTRLGSDLADTHIQVRPD